MFFPTLAIAALAGSVAAAPLAPRKAAPSGWASHVLEDYTTYHVRYLALECHKQHNTTFFDDCCHPLLAKQTLEKNRPSHCAANATALAAASSRVAAAASAASTNTAAEATPSDDAVSEWASATEQISSYVETATESATSVIGANLAAAVPTPSSSSTADAPAYTAEPVQVEEESTTEAAPTPTSTKAEKAKETKAAENDNSNDDSNNSNNNDNSGNSTPSGQSYSGQGTYYYQSEGADPSGLGSCGYKNSDSDYIAAISTVGSSWGNSQCGKQIMVQNTANGKTVQVQIVDNCPSCKDADSLDLSVPAFKAIADMDTGVINLKWWFL